MHRLEYSEDRRKHSLPPHTKQINISLSDFLIATSKDAQSYETYIKLGQVLKLTVIVRIPFLPNICNVINTGPLEWNRTNLLTECFQIRPGISPFPPCEHHKQTNMLSSQSPIYLISSPTT